MTSPDYDVAIVGGSIAGSAAAALFGQRRLRVALIEKSPDPSAYKTACTHFIQPSATPTIRRLGLAPLLEEAGAIPNAIDVWTRYGWVRHPGEPVIPHGYSLRRETLDPMLREFAASTGHVDLIQGRRAVGRVKQDGRVVGVRVASRDGAATDIRARLVVAADGRSSDMAGIAHVPTLTLPNSRFAYWAYFRDLRLVTGLRSQLWFLDPAVAYTFPNDDGLTLVVWWDLRRELSKYRPDVDRAIRSRFAQLDGAPRLEEGDQVTRWLGKLDVPNVRRRAAHRGMALVGDAAQASDPVWGVGCGWAFQSAEWLVDAAAPALLNGGDLGGALKAYRRRHRKELLAHHLVLSEYSTGRRLLPPERLIFAAAARDPQVATRAQLVAARLLPAQQLMSPLLMARAAAAIVRRQPTTSAADSSREHPQLSPPPSRENGQMVGSQIE